MTGSDDFHFFEAIEGVDAFDLGAYVDAEPRWKQVAADWAPHLVGLSGPRLAASWLVALCETYRDRCASEARCTVLEAETIARAAPSVYRWVLDGRLHAKAVVVHEEPGSPPVDQSSWPLHSNWVKAIDSAPSDLAAIRRAAEVVTVILDDQFVGSINDPERLISELHGLARALLESSGH